MTIKMKKRKITDEFVYKFRVVVNISVFLAFLLVFFSVEIFNIKQSSDVDGSYVTQWITLLTATLLLTSMALLLITLTITKKYASFVGSTFIVFSIIIMALVIYFTVISYISLFLVTEFILAIIMFFYGGELREGYLSRDKNGP
jgi:hypothetical protein